LDPVAISAPWISPEELVGRDRFGETAHCEPRQHVGDRRVKVDQPPLGQLQRHDRGERFADRAELEHRAVGGAVGARGKRPLAIGDRHRHR
jgi:hypothetical protein